MPDQPWHESDNFWEVVEPIMFNDMRRYLAGPEAQNAVSLAGVKPPAKVLDMCCGPGRHSIELARLGYGVTGVDRTRSYLEKARANSAQVEWIEADVRSFVRPEEFELAINLYTSFGYFEDQDEDRLVAENFYKSLKPGGKLVLSTLSKETISKHLVERTWEEDGELIVLDRRTILPEFSAVQSDWTIIRESTRKTVSFVVRLYAASEMRTLLESVGFKEIRFFGSLSGDRFDSSASRMIVVAGK